MKLLKTIMKLFIQIIMNTVQAILIIYPLSLVTLTAQTQEYIKQYSGNYLTPKEEGCLSYGTEFVIAGKGSDKENLASIVKRILIIREAINYQILLNSPKKQAQAMTVAAALAGALAAPEAVHAIKTGIVAVWALAESVEDVKILLSLQINILKKKLINL